MPTRHFIRRAEWFAGAVWFLSWFELYLEIDRHRHATLSSILHPLSPGIATIMGAQPGGWPRIVLICSALSPPVFAALFLGRWLYRSDSRVPAELVFDQGLGDLFVIRVAGNIVAPSQVDSVEFAASRFGTRLVVVMGHSQCGAVLATLEDILGRATTQSRNLLSIVDRVRPAIQPVLSGREQLDPDALMLEAVRANVRAAADHLRHGSELLERLIRHDGLAVVGAEYSLETGAVTIFDGVPEVR